MKLSAPFSLKVTVPLLLLVFALALSIVNVTYNVPRKGKEIEDRARQQSFLELSRLQGILEYLLRKGDVEGARREVAVLASNPEYTAVVLLDEKRVVLAATRRAWFGRPVGEVLPEFDVPIADQAAQQRRALVDWAPEGRSLAGYIGVILGGDEKALRPSRVGYLFFTRDLSVAKAIAREQILSQSIQWAGLVAALALVFWLIFHFMLTRRAERLVKAAERLAAGDLSTRSQLAGTDELARLSRAFDTMAARVADSQTRLSRDIAEREKAEQALRSSEEQYRAIFNASVDGIALWNAEAETVDMNPAFSEMLGYSREELMNTSPWKVIHSDHHTMFRKIRNAIKAGEPFHSEVNGLRKDGSVISEEAHGIPMRYQGQPHVLTIVRDLTEQKQAEEKRTALEAQLRQAQKMEAIGHLTGGIAHDFNNILTSVLGYTVLAQECQMAHTDPKLAKYLDQIHRSGARARDLIQQMLTFSRGQQGELRSLPLQPLVKEPLKLLESTVNSSIEFHTDFDPHAWPVLVDPIQIEQVIMNLCINARDAIDGSGVIELKVGNCIALQNVCSSCRKTVEGDYVELTVNDTGPGIAPEVMGRMFEPFFTTKEVGKGTGMGLSMVHGIIHEHGGHVVVETTDGKGAAFRILLPPNEEATGHVPGTDPGHSDTSVGGIAGRVLVVDDEISVVEFIADLLKTRGLEVVTKNSSTEAYELFSEDPERFDLVLTDQSMPKLTGLELARRLLEVKPDFPVILYTGHGEILSEEEIKARGIRKLLKKPIEIDVLFGVIKDLLS